MEHLLDLPDLERVTKTKKSKLYRLMQEGQFPRGILIGTRSRRWPASQVDAWIKQKIEEAA